MLIAHTFSLDYLMKSKPESKLYNVMHAFKGLQLQTLGNQNNKNINCLNYIPFRQRYRTQICLKTQKKTKRFVLPNTR